MNRFIWIRVKLVIARDEPHSPRGHPFAVTGIWDGSSVWQSNATTSHAADNPVGGNMLDKPRKSPRFKSESSHSGLPKGGTLGRRILLLRRHVPRAAVACRVVQSRPAVPVWYPLKCDTLLYIHACVLMTIFGAAEAGLITLRWMMNVHLAETRWARSST